MSLDSLLSDPILKGLPDLAKDYRIWLVGGAIRDHLLGHKPLEYDFAVDGDARLLARRFANASGGNYYELDEERDAGRVILIQPDGARRMIDFARIRGADITSDLMARDFSINALAVPINDPSKIVDPAKGLQDLKDRLIRACSDDSLAADPVRTLRGVRIATELDFRVDRRTSEQMEAAGSSLIQISAERIRDEFMRILSLNRPTRALRVLDHLGIMTAILPELEALRDLKQPPPHAYDALEHTLAVTERLGQLLDVLADVHDQDAGGDLVLAQASYRLGRFREQIRTLLLTELSVGRNRRQLLYFAALYHDAGKPGSQGDGEAGTLTFHGHERLSAEMVVERARQLRLSGREVDYLDQVVRHHMRLEWLEREEKITGRAVYRFFRDAGEAGVDAVLVSLADCLGKYAGAPPEDAWARRVEAARQLLQAFYEQRAQCIDPVDLVSGSDLISLLGLQPGPVIGRLLELVREAQAAGEIDSRDDAIALARKAITKGKA
jgi:tRNA nucleotidyltransferase/poly(A) polymerase